MDKGPRRPSNSRIATYSEFWPYYLREHSRPLTRVIHIVGTGLAAIALVIGLFTASLWLVVAALLFGYGPAWSAHFLVEKNRPATFRYPLWSLASDFRMTGLWLAGGLSAELTRAGVPQARMSRSRQPRN